jgi:hypothetical protein
MAFFIFPQAWIAPAITAAALAFGPIDNADTIHVEYVNFPGSAIAGTAPPNLIGIDKRPKSAWPKWKAQCALVHQYGHLAGRKHSANPNNIMYAKTKRKVCKRWLRQHHVK